MSFDYRKKEPVSQIDELNLTPEEKIDNLAKTMKENNAKLWRWLYVFMAVATVGVVILGVMGVLGVISFGTNLNDNDDIDDLQREQKHNHELFKRHHIPPTDVRILNDPYPEYAFNQVSGNEDDDDHASGNFKADGDVEFFHKFDSNGDVIPNSGSLTSHGPARFLEETNTYGEATNNGTNSDRLYTVWSGSAAVRTGVVLGRRKGKVAPGFNDFESVTVASDVVSAQGVHSFALGAEDSIVQYIGPSNFRAVGPVLGSPDDSDGLVVSNALLGSVAYAASGDCLFAGAGPPDGNHYVAAYVDPAGSGGFVELCRRTSVTPFAASCSISPISVAINETIIFNGVSHVPLTETFVVTYTSDTTGLISFVATVDTGLLTIVAGANSVIDGAHVTAECRHASALNKDSYMTYLWAGDSVTTVPVTAARYLVTGAVLSNVVAPMVLNPSLTTTFDADNVGSDTDFIAMTIRDDDNNAPGDVRMYLVAGASAPVFQSVDTYIEPTASLPATGNYDGHVTSFGEDGILVSYSAEDFNSAPVIQVWHLSTTLSGSSLIAGEDRPIGLYTTNGVFCSTIGGGDRALCLHDTRSTNSVGYSIRASKAVMSASGANDLFPRGVSVVHQGPTHALGVAMNDALPGELVAVREFGRSHTVDKVNQYTETMDHLFIHGDGSVTPNRKPIAGGAATYMPIADRCHVVSADTIMCNFIGL